MASLSINVPHRLSPQEALQRIQQMLGKLQLEQKDKISNVKENWKGETGNFEFTAMGFDIAGDIKVKQGSVDIDAKVPFAVSIFKGTIKELITKKAAELLS